MQQDYRNQTRHTGKFFIPVFAFAFIFLGYVARIFPDRPQSLVGYWAVEVSLIAIPAITLVVLAYANLLPAERYFYCLPKHPASYFLQSIICFGVFFFIIFVLKDFIWQFVWPFEFAHERQPSTEMAKTSSVSVAWFVVVLFLGAFVEEVVYRGMLFTLFEQRTYYLLFSPLLFAGIHLNQGLFGMVQAGLMGFSACILLLWTRNILPLITAHLGVNFCVLWVRSN